MTFAEICCCFSLTLMRFFLLACLLSCRCLGGYASEFQEKLPENASAMHHIFFFHTLLHATHRFYVSMLVMRGPYLSSVLDWHSKEILMQGASVLSNSQN